MAIGCGKLYHTENQPIICVTFQWKFAGSTEGELLKDRAQKGKSNIFVIMGKQREDAMHLVPAVAKQESIDPNLVSDELIPLKKMNHLIFHSFACPPLYEHHVP